MQLYKEHVNPHLGSLLHSIKMDKEYIQGEGCWLTDAQGNRYLDMIAAYGALPFGYNPPPIWEAINQVQSQQQPSFIQPSALLAAGELGQLLATVAPPGLTITTFANSGTEAVEAGLKLCRSATGRMGILSTTNSFHGKTLGSLSATGKAKYQTGFGAPVADFISIPYGDIRALEEALATRPEYFAAFLVEPIQGEGGIIVPPPGYLKEAQELCHRYGALLIMDEIQTGLGRTGQLFACEQEGLTPDVLLLAKALGGGLIPIGACLSSKAVFNEDFATKHSSTFAGNTLACRVGIASLNYLLEKDQALVKNAAQMGAYLKNGLLRLQDQYPDLISEVRGRGLMLGLCFGVSRDTFPGSMLGVLAEQDLLVSVISSYLLNVEGIRVAPTLNGSNVLRIEPPLIINQEECDRALAALGRMLKVLSTGNTATFTSYLIDKAHNQATNVKYQGRPLLPQPVQPNPAEGRFAFLVHPVDLKNYSDFDPSLTEFTSAELEKFINRLNNMVEPFVVARVQLVSAQGQTIFGEFISVPRTAEELLSLPEEQVTQEIKAAVELGIKGGAKIIGLGAYTSVAAKAGRLLLDCGVAITTGNSFTVVAAVDAVARAMERVDLRPADTTAAIVGATGAIGRALSLFQAENCARLILFGNPKWPTQSRRRLLRIAGEAVNHLVTLSTQGRTFPAGTLADRILKDPVRPQLNSSLEDYITYIEYLEHKNGLISVSTDLDAELPYCDIIISATSSPLTLLTPQNIKLGALVCDISRPGNVSPEVKLKRPDVLIFDGGIIEVPGRVDLGWNFGLDQGLVFGCMAETMLLSLEHHYEHTSIGTDLNLETISWLRELAYKHGFQVAELRSFNSTISPTEWEKVINERAKINGLDQEQIS